MSYNLMEFGGQSTVILRATTDFTVNDIHYQKDDVIFVLEDVSLDFSYNEKLNRASVGKQNIMFYDERYINTITISETSLTSDFLEIFCEKLEEKYLRTHIEKVFVTDKTAFLTNKITSNNIYIIDHGKYEIVLNEEYNSIQLITADFSDGEYTILYQEELDQPSYNINSSCSIPYLSMEIISRGNLDKINSNIYFTIPKVSLLNRPDYSLTNKVSSQNMSFKVIHDIVKVSI